MSAPWSADEEAPRRDIIAIELVEEHVSGAENDVAGLVAEAVARALDELTPHDLEEAAAGKVGRFRTLILKATETAVGAVEGTLRAKSLEGALKEAQIVDVYAAVRERNANAAKAEAEAAEIRQRTAFARLKETLAIFREMGIEVRPIQLSDGRLGIAIGDHLAVPLQELLVAENAEELPSPPAGAT